MKLKTQYIGAIAVMLAITICGLSFGAGAINGEDQPRSALPAVVTTPVSQATIQPVLPQGYLPTTDQLSGTEPQSAGNAVLSEPGIPAILRHDPTPSTWKVLPPPGLMAQLRSPAATGNVSIIVVYNTAASCPANHPANPAWTRQPWPAAAEQAMDFAALIWSTVLNGERPIIVHACWYSSLGPNVLGQATPSNFVQNFTNAPQANTNYPVALANQLANTDLNGSTPEIGASFSAAFTWYFGTDGNIPVNAAGNPTATDFVSVAMHEIGHGLGFLGSAGVDNGVAPAECNGTANVGCLANPLWSYDRFTQTGTTALTSLANPSAALGSALLGNNNLNFGGAAATSANGGVAARLFSPNPFQPGSSYVHLDEATFNNTVNALMTPAIGVGEVLHYPGPVGLGVLADQGWLTNGFTSAFVDWHNTGFEDGTSEHPYNTVQEGVAGVRDEGLVIITGGNYDEKIIIRRPVVLLRVDGVVTIGE